MSFGLISLIAGNPLGDTLSPFFIKKFYLIFNLKRTETNFQEVS